MSEDTFTVTLERKDQFRFVADFHEEGLPPLLLDEWPPLGEGRGPNPARLLGAAIGHCVSASALFCLTKAHVKVLAMRTAVTGTVVRNERGRLRIGSIDVRLHPAVAPEDRPRLARCLELFEDFCIVTQSVRQGVDVRVKVEPVGVDALAAGG
jgi:organic hydroperoxide reductase OsmC/OhrA